MKKPKVDTRKECKDGELGKLKSNIRRLKRDKERMSEQIKQLRKQVNEQQEYINKHIKDKPLREVVKNEKTSCNSCGSDDIMFMKLPDNSSLQRCRNCGQTNKESI